MRRRNAFLIATTTLGVFTAFTFVRNPGVGMTLPTHGSGPLARLPSVFCRLLPGGLEIEFGRPLFVALFEINLFHSLPEEPPPPPCLLPGWTFSEVSVNHEPDATGSGFGNLRILTDSHTLTLPFWPFLAGLLLAWWRPWKRNRPPTEP